eukprot:1391872-Amorphochlora_amoeboformis.AAC.1
MSLPCITMPTYRGCTIVTTNQSVYAFISINAIFAIIAMIGIIGIIGGLLGVIGIIGIVGGPNPSP